jgi:hypothetical protein
MHEVVGDVFIPSLASVSFAPIEVRKLIINKPKPYGVMSQRAERYVLAVNLELVRNTSGN